MYKNRETTDEIMLFTEHNLDTREDFDQSFRTLGDGHEKRNEEFKKFDGLVIKKPKAVIPANKPHKQAELEKNCSEKSIIFAPFNSSFSDFKEDEEFEWPSYVKELMQPKKSKIIKFSKKCKDLNREYESNNNADLDNGVYNAFVNE